MGTELMEQWVQFAKFRLRMASAMRDPVPEEAASIDELDHLIGLQLAHWQKHAPVAGAEAERLLHEWNRQSVSLFVFSIRGKRVRVWNKPVPTVEQRQDPAMRPVLDAARRRILLYKAFIGVVVSGSRTRYDLDFALDVSDLAKQHNALPVLCFQKLRGENSVLLPDVDFFHDRWYREAQDLRAYDDKSVRACFAGASTGGDLTVESVQNDALPRLRAAQYFHNSPEVLFKIAKAVQDTSDEARLLLQRKPYFSAHIDWPDQLQHRFILSMDGNGATCSRLVKGLMSNSVLIKYDSPYELYYFPALRAGKDYVLVRSDREVVEIVRAERAHPGQFRPVAESGRRFARKYLQVGSVVAYMDRLLAGFAVLNKGASRGN